MAVPQAPTALSEVPPPPPPPPPPQPLLAAAAGTAPTPHLALWRAISRRGWILLAELSVGPALLALEAKLTLRFAADTLPFFHQNAVLPIAALVGCRLGVLLFVKLVASYMVRSIRTQGWAHADSIEAFVDCIKPALLLSKLFVLSQDVLTFAECTNALRLFAYGSHNLNAIACWPMVVMCATASTAMAVEWTRLDHWRDALGKLHAMDVAKKNNKVTLKVPAKLRTLGADEENATCCICLSECTPGEVLAELRCKHIFHEACIKTWLCRVDSCPLRCSTGSVKYCKQPSAKEVEFKVGDSVEVKSVEAEPWRRGKVVCSAPLLVRPRGWLYAYPWEFVQPPPASDVLHDARTSESTPSHEHQD